MSQKSKPDSRKFINPTQIGGIERYVIDDGPARGVRALWVNTGGGLRYRILVDRGLDIDQAFFNQISLAFLTHSGPTFPTRALDRGLDWLKGFPGGLLTTCGPTHIGPPGQDEGEDLGLHGPHSNSPVELESVHQPRPHSGHDGMSVTAVVRYGAFYGPCIELRRTIGSMLGQNSIDVIDEFRNAGNQRVPHALLLHINFGYPLVDEGAELCFDSPRIEPLPTSEAAARFTPEIDFKRIPAPMDAHRGPDSSVAYLFPEPLDSSGRTIVGVLNEKLGLGVAVHYNTKQFPRCGNWQHFGPGEYVTALEPMNGTIDGRWKDRERGTLDFLEPGETRRYRYQLRVLSEPGKLDELRRLNRREKRK
jgi:hypothetical protein